MDQIAHALEEVTTYCTKSGIPLDTLQIPCPSCGASELARGGIVNPGRVPPSNIGIHHCFLVLALVVLGTATLVAIVHERTKQPRQPDSAVHVQQQVGTPAPKPAVQEQRQNPLESMRESIAVQLQRTLSDGGYDITVGVSEISPPTLLLHGEIFKDTDTRVESLQMLRSIANDRLCPWGFRKVNIGAGLFSGSDYSLHCAGQE